MHLSRFVGRVGGLGVALGVGIAAVTGWGSGIAAADDSSDSASSHPSSTSSGQNSESGLAAGSDRSAEVSKPRLQTRSSAGTTRLPQPTRVKLGDTMRSVVRDAVDSLDRYRDARGKSQSVIRGRLAPRTDWDDESPATTSSPTVDRTLPERSSRPATDPDTTPVPALSHPESVDAESITSIPKSVSAAMPGARAARFVGTPVAPVPPPHSTPPVVEVAAEPEPAPTPAGRMLATAATALATTVLNPFAAGTFSKGAAPASPTAPPAAWAMLAFARREIAEPIRPPRDLLTGTMVTEEIATPVALAPGIVVPPGLRDNVIATGGPSLTDRITVFAMEIMQGISEIIGVNITMELGGLIQASKPPWFTTIGLDVKRDSYEGGDVWIITPPNATGEHVIAVHGSGFIYQPNVIHWLDYAHMARQTGATIVVPKYPLLPDGATVGTTLPPLTDFIANQVETYGAENVSVYADSAGGTLAMLAVQKIVRDCAGDASCQAARVPSRMVLISPGVGGNSIYTDPNVPLVRDPVSPIPREEDWDGWHDGAPEEFWNPMLGPFEGLPPITIYSGTREVATPGTLLFVQKMLDENPDADITLVLGMGQIHNWAQGGPIPINSQASKYRADVYRQLGLTGE